MAPQYISDGFRAGNFITGTGNYAENDGKILCIVIGENYSM